LISRSWNCPISFRLSAKCARRTSFIAIPDFYEPERAAVRPAG
jgi:hypothetical protein